MKYSAQLFHLIKDLVLYDSRIKDKSASTTKFFDSAVTFASWDSKSDRTLAITG